MVAVTARDVMSREFVGVSEGDDVGAVVELMVDQAVDDALVLRGDDPVGAVSARTLLEAAAAEGVPDEPVETVMGPAPDPVCVDSDVDTVLARLSSAPGGLLPVADAAGDLVGVVAEADVIAAASSLLSGPRESDAPVTEAVGAAGNGVDAAAVADRAGAETGQPSASPESSAQSVCEACGSLAGDLAVVNGQSICPDCRDV